MHLATRSSQTEATFRRVDSVQNVNKINLIVSVGNTQTGNKQQYYDSYSGGQKCVTYKNILGEKKTRNNIYVESKF